MALSKITYTNKETLNEQPSIADKNKVKADDMNEIKSVVNAGIDAIEENQTDITNIGTYSTSETNTGKTWIDGKPIYRKVLTFTTGSSAGDMSVNIGESNIDKVVYSYGFTFRDSDGEERPMPNIYRNMSSEYALAIYSTTRTGVQLTYGGSRTNMSGYIIVEYTKTTD